MDIKNILVESDNERMKEAKTRFIYSLNGYRLRKEGTYDGILVSGEGFSQAIVENLGSLGVEFFERCADHMERDETFDVIDIDVIIRFRKNDAEFARNLIYSALDNQKPAL